MDTYKGTRRKEQHSHIIQNIYNFKHFKSKEPLSMYFIDLKSAENTGDNFNAQSSRNEKSSDIKSVLYDEKSTKNCSTKNTLHKQASRMSK